MTSRNPYAPPQARVADLPDPSGAIELGGRGARLGAAIIDTIVLLIVALPLLFLLNWVDDAESFRGSLRNAMLGFALFMVVNGYLLAQHGQTIGKKLLGLRIVRTDGSRAGFGRLLGLRYAIGTAMSALPVVGALYALVDSLLIFRVSRKCLHDNIADTIVIKA
jgi:uncharacterized RDD family membrane protein YckC